MFKGKYQDDQRKNAKMFEEGLADSSVIKKTLGKKKVKQSLKSNIFRNKLKCMRTHWQL